MRLHDQQWGSGERVALLLHGMVSSAASWWQVAPALAARGYRVMALDLPGHGASAAAPRTSVTACADDVLETLADLVAGPPELAIGHSVGGLVLAAAAARLRPSRAVYVDAPFAALGDGDLSRWREHYRAAKEQRTPDALRRVRPGWSDQDRRVEARAAERFDVETAAALAVSACREWVPPVPPVSVLVRPVPSRSVSDADVPRLLALGLEVRDLPGAGHTAWYGRCEQFIGALADWL